MLSREPLAPLSLLTLLPCSSRLHEVTGQWTSHPHTSEVDGASIARAVPDNEGTYRDLARWNQYAGLTALACERGDRWHHTAPARASKLIEAKA